MANESGAALHFFRILRSSLIKFSDSVSGASSRRLIRCWPTDSRSISERYHVAFGNAERPMRCAGRNVVRKMMSMSSGVRPECWSRCAMRTLGGKPGSTRIFLPSDWMSVVVA